MGMRSQRRKFPKVLELFHIVKFNGCFIVDLILDRKPSSIRRGRRGATDQSEDIPG